MRARCVLGIVLAACGGSGSGAAPRAAPADRPFERWPSGTTVAIRLPAPAAVDAQPEAFAALATMLGRGEAGPRAFLFGTDVPAGIARDRCPYAAMGAGGAWMRMLPASEMASLRAALAGEPREIVAQEVGDFLVLARGMAVGEAEEPALPPGDLALRVRHHPLLALVAEAGDTLEVALTPGGGGLDFRGRLAPGPGSPTAEILAGARAGEGGMIDFLPPGLAIRLETTVPAVSFAAPVARRLARHVGAGEAQDPVRLERFLREALSGVDPHAGLAIGVEARRGATSVVVVARDAPGPVSPILAKARAEERSSFGSLVLDLRDAPDGLVGWDAWVAQATPALEGLPECLWDAVARLADEARGLPVAYAAFDGWSVLAAGPRADALVRVTRSRLEAGASRTPAGVELFRLRGEGKGDYVLGLLVEPSAAELPAEDRATLREAFGATAEARAPGAVAVAGFRAEGALDLLGRVLY